MTGHRNIQIQKYGSQDEIANQKVSAKGTNVSVLLGRLGRAVVFAGTVMLSLALCGQTTRPSAPVANVNNSAHLKLPVAHAHFGSWCMGYLTITPEGIRYDAVRSHGKDEHSFSLQRDQVLFLNYWMLAGQPMNAVEIRTANKNYHFWLMQSAEEMQYPGWRPVAAASSDTLLLSLYYWRVTGNVPDLAAVNAAMAQATPSGNGAVSNDPYEQMSQHMYANTNSNASVSRQINSINHMSHW